MKHLKSALMLLSIPMLLTGCFRNSVSKEKFLNQLDEAKAETAIESTKVDNVQIHNKLNIESWNYKVGEFYSHHYFAIALIVPINYGEYTWTEDGKFYHATKIVGKDLTTSEITKEQFENYMEGHRATISGKLREPILSTESYLYGNDDTYKVESSKLTYQPLSKEYRSVVVTSTQEPDPNNYEQTITRKRTFTFVFKNKLPKTYTTKENWDGGSEQKWSYSYGDAKFHNPTSSNE